MTARSELLSVQTPYYRTPPPTYEDSCNGKPYLQQKQMPTVKRHSGIGDEQQHQLSPKHQEQQFKRMPIVLPPATSSTIDIDFDESSTSSPSSVVAPESRFYRQQNSANEARADSCDSRRALHVTERSTVSTDTSTTDGSPHKRNNSPFDLSTQV